MRGKLMRGNVSIWFLDKYEMVPIIQQASSSDIYVSILSDELVTGNTNLAHICFQPLFTIIHEDGILNEPAWVSITGGMKL